ncbi:hypothetical protein MGI18_16920 [Bacillus sp. OVS6]|nr:hypothetical protein MGI18_16920 [Bacillus sp. OVS6]
MFKKGVSYKKGNAFFRREIHFIKSIPTSHLENRSSGAGDYEEGGHKRRQDRSYIRQHLIKDNCDWKRVLTILFV